MKATLDGFIIPVDAGFGWSEREGTAPEQRDFRMPKELADKIFAQAKNHKSVLVIDATEEGRGIKTFDKLTVLSTSPTDNPSESTLLVSDLRWTWQYPHIYRAYNVRTTSGRKRRINDNGPQASDVIADDQKYAVWSINKKTNKAWTTDEIVEDVLNRIAGIQGQFWFNRSVIGSVKLPEQEGFIIDASHDAAMGQLIQALGGGISIFVNPKGTVVLYNRLDDTERRLVGAPDNVISTRVGEEKPLIVGNPTWSIQNNEKLRPKDWVILFERKIELRADFQENTATFTTVSRQFPPPRWDNVVESPEDFTFEGLEVVATQIITLPFYLRYLAGKQPFGLPILTLDVIRRGWLHGVLEAYSSPALDPSGLWAIRVDAIRAAYRVLYQLQREWRERIRTVSPEILSVQDNENNVRARSPIFSDYAQYETWRSRGSSLAARPEVFDQIRNRYANPARKAVGGGGIVGTPIKDLTPAKAILSVEDEDQVIIGANFGVGNDPSQRASRIVRSAIIPQSNPTDDIQLDNLWLQEGNLQRDYEMSSVMTITLGSPADLRRYHAVRVSLQEARQFVPNKKQFTVPGKAPTMFIRIPAALIYSKFGWDDAKADQFYQTFSENGDIDKLDEVLGDPINKETIDIIAKAAAAKNLMKWSDRVEGGARLAMDPTLTVRGNADKVSWEADPRQGAVSDIEFAKEGPGVELLAVLPPSIQRVVQKFVNTKD